MRKIKSDEILNKSDFPSMSDKDFLKQVERYCLDKMTEYEVTPKKTESLKEYPNKKYEIFMRQGSEVSLLSGDEKDLINKIKEESEKGKRRIHGLV